MSHETSKVATIASDKNSFILFFPMYMIDKDIYNNGQIIITHLYNTKTLRYMILSQKNENFLLFYSFLVDFDGSKSWR
ncbi:MAG: hypothetical protein Kapaf2KO_19310 [Candidatus Kapaibacteriales bacterium]